MHHLCYEVDDILAARDRLKAAGARVLGDGSPRSALTAKPVLFLHPKDFPALWSNSNRHEAAMNWAPSFAVFIVLWWTVLFAVLPYG